MLSIWEKLHWTKADLVVIGGGIVGLSTAISWKEKHPEGSVIVLERGTLPTGASTRNAGFACFGSLTELLVDIEKLGKDGMLSLVEKRWMGLQKLRARLGDTQIDLQINGGYELLREKELHALDKVDEINSLLLPLLKRPVFSEAGSKVSGFGFNEDKIKGMLYNPFEGQLDSGKMMKNLTRLTREKNIEIRTGCEVKQLDIDNNKIIVRDDVRNDYALEGEKIAVCTNAFAKDLIPELQIEPGRGIVIVTEPVKNLPFKGTFHYDEGYYYFRDFNNRIIFGGGRNLALQEETTTSFSINEIILQNLKDELQTTLMPGKNPKVDMHWAGIMAFGENKEPVIKLINKNVGVAVRLGGMGVAIGSLAGDELASLLGKK